MSRLLLALALLTIPLESARAACDLDQLIGYTLVFAKPIEAYIQDGRRIPGFTGCTRDRVLVFGDNTGVRCLETNVSHASAQKAYLFARSATDMKLCVENDLYKIAPAE